MIAIDLTNKTAFVTGASRGLGLAIASTLHSVGANVVVNFLDDEGEANRVDAESLGEALGDRAVAIGADVRDRRQLDAAMDQAIAKPVRANLLTTEGTLLACALVCSKACFVLFGETAKVSTAHSAKGDLDAAIER